MRSTEPVAATSSPGRVESGFCFTARGRCFDRSGEPGELKLSGSSAVVKASCDKSDLLNHSTFGLGISEIF